MQCLRVEYLVLLSFSHTCTLAQEQPVSDYSNICPWLSLFRGTDTLMSFPNLKHSIKTVSRDVSMIISQPEIYSSTQYL